MAARQGVPAYRPRGVVRHGEPLSRHTVWGIGGPARTFFVPADADDLAAFLAAREEPAEPLLWLGLGSNVLVRDGGFPGTVVHTVRLDRLEPLDGARIRAEAGVPSPKVARFAAARRLGGCEFLAGIPGTLGGALAMNAGAFGGETWPLVESVETVDGAGRRRRRDPGDFAVGYRSVTGPPDEWFLGAVLALAPDADGRARARIRELLARRAEAQPTGVRSCGSVFRNPPGDHAGRLVEACGLKGAREGGAVVSKKHANFIVNAGGARAADVERLMRRVADAVRRETGVCLEPEVRVVGVPAGGGGGGG